MYQLLYKQCCSEHWGTCAFFNFGFLRVHAQYWDCWIIWQFYSQFFEESPYCLPQWLYQFTFLPTLQNGSVFSTPSPAFIVCRLFDDGHSDWCEVIPLCSFDLQFDVEHLFICLLDICKSSLEKCLFRSSAHFLIEFFWYSVVGAAYILWKSILCQLFHLLVFSLILRAVFSPCLQFLCCAKAFKLNQVPLVYFCFYFQYSRRCVIGDLSMFYIIHCYAYVFL